MCVLVLSECTDACLGVCISVYCLGIWICVWVFIVWADVWACVSRSMSGCVLSGNGVVVVCFVWVLVALVEEGIENRCR